MKGNSILTWIILILLGIGIINTLILKPSSIIIPLIIFGGIYYFLKHPEKLRKFTDKKHRGYHHHHNRAGSAKGKYKDVKFTVINGNKDKDDEPKYH